MIFISQMFLFKQFISVGNCGCCSARSYWRYDRRYRRTPQRGRRRWFDRQSTALTKEQLDNEIDDFMSITRSRLDAELDTYMATETVH